MKNNPDYLKIDYASEDEKAKHKEIMPQILFISHKEESINKSDSLVGVTQKEYDLYQPSIEQDYQLNSIRCTSSFTVSVDMRNLK